MLDAWCKLLSEYRDLYRLSLKVLPINLRNYCNFRFGSGIRSMSNGIIYNNEMDDFGTPGLINLYDYPPAKANFIKPGKRPLSSMSPTVVTDKSGDVIMVAGASGGSRIITSTTLVDNFYYLFVVYKSFSRNHLF